MPGFENAGSGNNPKESEGYLSQIANNPDEKIGELVDAIIKGQLPKAPDGRLKILELGTGGGESIGVLKKALDGRGDADVFAVDVSVGILRKIQSEQGVPSVAADAMKLPFKENSLSAINASAVFHEVSSYGSFGSKPEIEAKKPYGREAVKRAFIEIQGALMPEGMLTYRDVYCPDGIFEEKTVSYNSKAWKHFAKWFYPEFLEADARAFPQDGQPRIEEDGEPMKLTASKHLHRELQRHYLMLRDYLRTQLADNIGLEVVKEEWVDKEKGIKTHEFLARGVLYQLLKKGETEEGYGKYTMQSEEYDALFDKLIEQILEQELNAGSPIGVELSGWKKREGKEVYTYASTREMLDVACESSAEAKDGRILFPKIADDIRVLPRDYYNRYLQEVVDAPEFDGKQIVRFHKISLQEALQALDGLENHQMIGDVASLKERIKALI
jgi:hypothetical protein